MAKKPCRRAITTNDYLLPFWNYPLNIIVFYFQSWSWFFFVKFSDLFCPTYPTFFCYAFGQYFYTFQRSIWSSRIIPKRNRPENSCSPSSVSEEMLSKGREECESFLHSSTVSYIVYFHISICKNDQINVILTCCFLCSISIQCESSLDRSQTMFGWAG